MHRHLSSWRNKISKQPIPILSSTNRLLTELLQKPKLSLPSVVNVVQQDPGLSVQVLRCANSKNTKNNKSEIRSIEQAIKILEISKIKTLAQSLPTIEKHTSPETRELLYKTYYKAYHSAKQAEQWAKQQHDEMPDEIYAATFMHFLGEMYISIYVPNLFTFVNTLHNNSNLVNEEAQYVVLGFSFAEMSLELADIWCLPKFIQQSLHIENVEKSRSYGVILAAELIQHASENWYSEKTWGLCVAAAAWLEVRPEQLITEVHQLAATIARENLLTEVKPLANSLLHHPKQHQFTQDKTLIGTSEYVSETVTESTPEVTICLTPQYDEFNEILAKLKNYKHEIKDFDEALQLALHGFHDGIGLNRVVFYLLLQDKNILYNCHSIGAENDPQFNKFRIDISKKNIFGDLLSKPQAIWLHSDNKEKIIKRLPPEFYKIIAIETFFAMSVFANNKPLGLFYADRHSRTCSLDEKAYVNFKLLSLHANEAINYFS